AATTSPTFSNARSAWGVLGDPMVIPQYRPSPGSTLWVLFAPPELPPPQFVRGGKSKPWRRRGGGWRRGSPSGRRCPDVARGDRATLTSPGPAGLYVLPGFSGATAGSAPFASTVPLIASRFFGPRVPRAL